jgi:virginiamycin B lyase
LQAGYQVAVGGGAVWVANSDRNSIYRIDPLRNTWQELPGNGAPFSLAFGAGFLWVTNQSDGILSQVDPSTGAILHTVALPTGHVDGPIAVGPHAVLVAERGPRGSIVRVDPTTLAQTALGTGFVWLAYGEGAFWAVDFSAYGVMRLDARTARPVASGAFVGNTTAIAAGEGSVWVSVPDAVVQIDPGRVREVKRFPRAGAGWALAVGYGSLWLADATAGRVVRVDVRTGRVIATIDVGPNPSDIAVGEGAVWVAGHPAIS